MPIFPVIQLRSPRSCHLLPYREGRGSAESWRSGGFPGGRAGGERVTARGFGVSSRRVYFS